MNLEPPTERLERLLAAAADQRTQDYWERYLKGTARFRGVPMAGIRRALAQVWDEAGLDAWPTADLMSLSHRWFANDMSEDKLAAVLLITERLLPRLTTDSAPLLAAPLSDGHIADWGVCDWYATKALHGFITADADRLEPRARAVAAWAKAPGLWQRRAAVVAFVKIAPKTPHPFPGFVDLMLDACAGNLVSDDRFAHTGPGWLLRELSRVEPARVQRFVEEHPELSAEARRMATARLRPGPYRRR